MRSKYHRRALAGVAAALLVTASLFFAAAGCGGGGGARLPAQPGPGTPAPGLGGGAPAPDSAARAATKAATTETIKAARGAVAHLSAIGDVLNGRAATSFDADYGLYARTTTDDATGGVRINYFTDAARANGAGFVEFIPNDALEDGSSVTFRVRLNVTAGREPGVGDLVFTLSEDSRQESDDENGDGGGDESGEGGEGASASGTVQGEVTNPANGAMSSIRLVYRGNDIATGTVTVSDRDRVLGFNNIRLASDGSLVADLAFDDRSAANGDRNGTIQVNPDRGGALRLNAGAGGSGADETAIAFNPDGTGTIRYPDGTQESF